LLVEVGTVVRCQCETVDYALLGTVANSAKAAHLHVGENFAQQWITKECASGWVRQFRMAAETKCVYQVAPEIVSARYVMLWVCLGIPAVRVSGVLFKKQYLKLVSRAGGKQYNST
jgi:hypothetical protein